MHAHDFTRPSPWTDPPARWFRGPIEIGVVMKRWPLGAAAAVLALSACSAPGGAGNSTGDPTGPALPESAHIDGMFSIGDRELYLSCSGSGEPTILLESGESQGSDALYPIRAATDTRAHVCSYDRANIGMSGPADTPRSVEQISADLEALLRVAGVPGPFVLVGHSAGGMFVQHYARTHLDQVLGVVAMNPVPRYDWVQELMFPEMTEEERAAETGYYEGDNAEAIDYAASSEQLAAAPAPGQLPFTVVVSTDVQCAAPDDTCSRTYPAYEAIMTETAREWDHSAVVQAPGAGHDIHVDNIDAVLSAINDILVTGGYDGLN
jgi:pimeloyl-ACP methyl ester carboxylesterase